jgi:hypothetical protein
MTFADLIATMKRADKNAEVIFDRDEPIGTPTDLVMPRRRWFGRKAQASIARPGPAASKIASTQS